MTGVKPKRLLAHEEEQILAMFSLMQKPFEQNKSDERSNFLSYSYILFKICELLKIDWILSYFKLLKGDDKLHQQDQTWKKICVSCDWPFIPRI